MLVPAGGTPALRAGGLWPLWWPWATCDRPLYILTTQNPSTLHGPLTYSRQPHMVPSLAQDNPTWSPHPPLMTPHGPLTHLGQLIKYDLVWTDLVRSFVTEEEKKGTKCISMVVDYIRRKDIENNSWPFHSHVCSSLKIWSPNQTFLTL